MFTPPILVEWGSAAFLSFGPHSVGLSNRICIINELIKLCCLNGIGEKDSEKERERDRERERGVEGLDWDGNHGMD